MKQALFHANLNKLLNSYPGIRIPIFINIYTLFKGAYHTSIEAGEYEVAFGKTKEDLSGIYAIRSTKNA